MMYDHDCKLRCKKNYLSYYKKGKIYDANGPIDGQYLIFYTGAKNGLVDLFDGSLVFNSEKGLSWQFRLKEYFYDEQQTLRYLKLLKINQ